MANMKVFKTNLLCYTVESDTWIYRKTPNHNIVWMKLSDKTYDKYFKIIHNFHAFLNDNGYVVEKQQAHFFKTAFDDNLIEGYQYFFDICNEDKQIAEEAIKWIIGPLKELMTEHGYSGFEYHYLPFTPYDLRVLIKAVFENKVTATMGKTILQMMFEAVPVETCLAMDQFKIADDSDLNNWIDELMKNNPDKTEQAKANSKVAQWFVGQVMKVSKGKANASKVQEILKQKLAA